MNSSNQSTWIEYEEEINHQANLRDSLMKSLTDLLITSSHSILFQSFLLSQITQSTNELTRTASIRASNKCMELSRALYSISSEISFEDVQSASRDLLECASNVLTVGEFYSNEICSSIFKGINGPLQERCVVLQLDLFRADRIPDEFDTDLESEDLFSENSNREKRNTYYQKQALNQITDDIDQIVFFLTSALNIHLNLEQDFLVNSSTMIFFLEKFSNQSSNTSRMIRDIDQYSYQLTFNRTDSSHLLRVKCFVCSRKKIFSSFDFSR